MKREKFYSVMIYAMFGWAVIMCGLWVKAKAETDVLKVQMQVDSLECAYQISLRDSINAHNIEVNNSLVKHLTYIPHD